MSITTEIERYLEPIKHDPNQRYKSWDHCYYFFRNYKSFNSNEHYDHASLHLGMYLASWGMYRGSTFLLQKDYKIHYPVIIALLDPAFSVLWDINFDNSNSVEIALPLIFKLKGKIVHAYKNNIKFVNGKLKSVEVSDTLVTKILLGTMGCVPAYDTLFKSGLRKERMNQSFSKSSILGLINFYYLHRDEFELVQLENYFPIMKLIDMYFWERGNE
jgi:hypothetical protein